MLYPMEGSIISRMDMNKPHYLGHRKRLRDRFMKNGIEGFADYEVIELILTLAIPRSDVKERAKLLIKKYGHIKDILDAPTHELQKLKGIGSVTPIAIRIMREVATLYLQQTEENKDIKTDTEALSSFWRMKIGPLTYEVFEVAYLDTGSRLLRDGVERLEKGTVDRASVYPRQLVEAALKRGAAAVVIAHNHPNGDVNPSEQDILLTRSLSLAAEAVQLKVLDHLIVSKDQWFSFRKRGLI